MTSIIEDSLVLQREKLRQQLQEQRKLIALQLSPTKTVNHHYPRSMTVRFLKQRQPLLGKLFSELMVVMVGVRLYKLLSALLIMIRIIKSRSAHSQMRLAGSVRQRTE